MTVELYCGDCAEVMRGFPADCIDLTVTSPPYDNLRKYNGYTFDFESIAQQLYRVTKPGGVVVWVVGDATVNGSETGTSFRQALYFMGLGFNLHDTMIYQKDAIAFPDASRYQQCFEFMFVLSKGVPSTKNILADRRNVSFGRTITGTNRDVSGETQRMAGYGKEIKKFGYRWNIWEIPTDKGNVITGHPAQFPEALARDHILSWSNPGDTVLDPMCGSGTTGKMAVKYDRNFIGIDISDEYINGIAQRRIREAQMQPNLFDANAAEARRRERER